MSNNSGVQLFSGEMKSALLDFFLYSYLMLEKRRADTSLEELNDIYKKAANKVLAVSSNDSVREVLMSVINSSNPAGSLVASLESMLDSAMSNDTPRHRLSTHVGTGTSFQPQVRQPKHAVSRHRMH